MCDRAVAVEARLVEIRMRLRDRRAILGDLVAERALGLGDVLVAGCASAELVVCVAGEAGTPPLERVPDRRDDLDAARPACEAVARLAARLAKRVGEPAGIRTLNLVIKSHLLYC